jgi:hypothetical protein
MSIHARSERMLRISFGVVVLSMLLAAPAAAQTVTGRVVGDADSEPIRGAVVTLLSTSGERLRAVLTNASGAFQIQAAPGSYRLRAEMIGRTTSEVEVVVGPAPVSVRLALPYAPIPLDGLLVEAETRCKVPAEAAALTLRVWEEVQKALRAESITRELGIYEFDIQRTRQTRDPATMQRISKTVLQGKSVAQQPFSTLPPEEIAESGYAKVVNGQTMIYGPTTEVLLSPGFQETHCFSLRRARGRPDQIGLQFKPISGRKVTDIEGTIWIDDQTAELRRLEFKYKRVPSDLALGSYTGFAEFQRLEAGAWIIGSWELNTPGVVEAAQVSALEPIHTRAWAADAPAEAKDADGNGAREQRSGNGDQGPGQRAPGPR